MTPGQQRALPEQANLRYLKLEAKRRLAAGEFPALHQAQRAIAMEHGLPSWAALKHLIDDRGGAEGYALTHLRWVISRFSGAGGSGWAVPGEEELREHFTEEFLAAVPPGRLIATIMDVAGDPRTASPSTTTSGDVPAAVPGIAAAAVAELGLPGLVLAGGVPGPGGSAGDIWSAATGWASLEHAEVLRADHGFPAHEITTVITAVAVLRLAADGRLGLDDPANRYLRAVRLADDTVTVRELLLHTGGTKDPSTLFAPTVPDLVTVTGPVLACTGRRGVFAYNYAGYAALGQLITDLTGWTYPDAATRLVLRPLGMNRSRFPLSWPDAGVVAGYDVAADGSFELTPARVCAIPAAGGLWTTAGDLVRFGLAWSSLLPRALAREALRPQAVRPGGTHSGLGWIVNEPAGLAGHAGDGPSAAASLLVPLTGGRAHAALANRPMLVEPVNGEVLRAVEAEAPTR